MRECLCVDDNEIMMMMMMAVCDSAGDNNSHALDKQIEQSVSSCLLKK